MQKIILASQSPRRKQLLEWAEIGFDIMVRHTDETYPASLSQNEIPVYIARQKALAVQDVLQADRLVLAADTIVTMENEVIGKPADRDDAVSILKKLSGQWHQVITGVVLREGKKELAFSDTTLVKFHPLTEAQILFYVDKYQPFDKAGAYAIQEWIGVTGIQRIEGDFYNVMGLPVSRVVQAIKEW